MCWHIFVLFPLLPCVAFLLVPTHLYAFICLPLASYLLLFLMLPCATRIVSLCFPDASLQFFSSFHLVLLLLACCLPADSLLFSCGFPMVFLWLSWVSPMVFCSRACCFLMAFSLFSCCFPVVFLCLSYAFPLAFLRLSPNIFYRRILQKASHFLWLSLGVLVIFLWCWCGSSMFSCSVPALFSCIFHRKIDQQLTILGCLEVIFWILLVPWGLLGPKLVPKPFWRASWDAFWLDFGLHLGTLGPTFFDIFGCKFQVEKRSASKPTFWWILAQFWIVFWYVFDIFLTMLESCDLNSLCSQNLSQQGLEASIFTLFLMFFSIRFMIMFFITFLSFFGGFWEPFGNHLGNMSAYIFQHFFKSHLKTTKLSKMTSKREGAFF